MHTASNKITGLTEPNEQEPIIEFENVSVKYRIPHERLSGIKEFTIRWLQRRISYEQFYALHKVSFQIRRGDVFGIVGQNGAGKSTMLKVMARVLQPNEGRVIMRGHIAPLLELGGGFHQELTGRENIFLNMSLLGYPHKKTLELFDSIVDFAGIREFIDTPIRTYSTGMVARLGFAVATSVRPDILLVDEVLSVGDTSFQEKCLDRMFSFQEQGTTIVIVSHSMGTVEAFCDSALWLDKGEIQTIGSTKEVIDKYLNIDHSPPIEIRKHREMVDNLRENTKLSPSNEADYVNLNNIGNIYRADSILDVNQGSICGWLRAKDIRKEQLSAIFHTDDSRYVLYVRVKPSLLKRPATLLITGRAGGNRRSFDQRSGSIGFPEITGDLYEANKSTAIKTPENQWHMVTITWEGYPSGKFSLYIDGRFKGEKFYDHRNDDGKPLPKYISIGMRPLNWTGELINRGDGTTDHLHPGSTMSLLDSGIELMDLRLYKSHLSPEDIKLLYEEQLLKDSKG